MFLSQHYVSVTTLCFCHNIMFLSQHYVSVTTLWFKYNIMFEVQLYISVSTLCFCHNIMFLSQHYVTSTTLCFRHNSMFQVQHFVSVTILCFCHNIAPCSPCRACADPESFVRWGPNSDNIKLLFFFSCWGKGDQNATKKRAVISQPVKRHCYGISLAGRWWPNIECWLCSFVIFQWIQTSIANLYFCDFSGGGGGGPDPLSPSGSAHAELTLTTEL